MLIRETVDWEGDVLAAWCRSCRVSAAPNKDVWGRLPSGVCWFRCTIEQQDIGNVYLIGSEDWKEVFGTYHLPAINARQVDTPPDDPYRHKSRISQLKQAYATGWSGEPVILVAQHGHGPFVTIDGNHRALAMNQLGILAGQSCFIGFHRQIDRFLWFHRSLAD